MPVRSLAHLSDGALLHDLATLVALEHATIAEVLAHIAEVDTRRLFLPAGYSSMHVYCVEALGLSADAAYKRIQAARIVREFPILFEAVADGRLNLTGVCLVAPHVTTENETELLAAIARRSNAEVRQALVRFPLRNAPTLALSPSAPAERPLPIGPLPEAVMFDVTQLAAQQAETSEGNCNAVEPTVPDVAPGHCEAPALVASAATPIPGPPVRQRDPLIQLKAMLRTSTRERLLYARSLLSHTNDHTIDGVLARAMDLLIPQLERQKFAATKNPRQAKSSSLRSRHIPAYVKRAVWLRDEGRCTFVSESGHRCTATTLLEYDHVVPVARGGVATIEDIRLRCRPHNQHEAERVFGTDFMQAKRDEARRRRAAGDGDATRVASGE